MKLNLICELNMDPDSLSAVSESVDGQKSYYIDGIYMTHTDRNQNGRWYPRDLMLEQVEDYSAKFIKMNRALGELGHPEHGIINCDRASHKVLSLKEDGHHIIGRAKILDKLPMGKIAFNLLEEGVQLGVSSRVLGKQNDDGEVRPFKMRAIDIVHDPSAPMAFVRGILEGRDFTVDDAGDFVDSPNVLQETLRNSLGELPERRRKEQAQKAFQMFLESVIRSKSM